MNRFKLQEHPLLPLAANETDGTPVEINIDARWPYLAVGILCGLFWREVWRWVF